MCALWCEPFIIIVNRNDQSTLKVRYPQSGGMEDTQCTDLLGVPMFDGKENPYIFLRTSKAISLLDLKSLSMYNLLVAQNQSGSHGKMFINIDQQT